MRRLRYSWGRCARADGNKHFRTLHIVFHVVAAGLILARFYLAHLEGLPLAIMVPGVLLADA